MKIQLFAIFLACTLLSLRAPEADESDVDLNLVLAIDVSHSVSNERWQLQRRGYAAAFRDPKVIRRITSDDRGKIVVTVVQWSGSPQQIHATAWHVISGEESGELFAQALEAMPREYRHGTAISPALIFCAELLDNAPRRAKRSVIDISGDGKQEDGWGVKLPDLMWARSYVLSRDITINALALMIPSNKKDSEETLQEYERLHGGRNSFLMVVENADDYEQFVMALKQKLMREMVAER